MRWRRGKKNKKNRTSNPSRSSECAGKQPGDWRQTALLLCGRYLFQGGSEQIGANGTARVCFVSQHAAEAWASHRRLSLACAPISFMLEGRPFLNLQAEEYVCVCGCQSTTPLCSTPHWKVLQHVCCWLYGKLKFMFQSECFSFKLLVALNRCFPCAAAQGHISPRSQNNEHDQLLSNYTHLHSAYCYCQLILCEKST